ncbi:Fimbrial assembly protein (PilN) [Propionispira arboris]|uniref:Fimbrial assembly protein (PilN) n=1 Tax=Propionispira arboris TaxID=84035 RepID=A0A1H6W8R9_9FIRM|nr:PilN domain-containing protein [Propionispira arboris]SEJ08892.1 Fimbrial assembly protein (PilN) [Propionispira arboris]
MHKNIKFWQEKIFVKTYEVVLGIVIGEHTIQIVKLDCRDKIPLLLRSIEIQIPQIYEEDSLALLYKALLQKTIDVEGLAKCAAVVAFSAKNIFSCLADFPVLEGAALREAIKWDVEKYIPFLEGEYHYDFQIVEKKEMKITVRIAAMDKVLLDTVATVFQVNSMPLLGVLEADALQGELIEATELGFVWQSHAAVEQNIAISSALDSQSILSQPDKILPAVETIFYKNIERQQINLLPFAQRADDFVLYRLFAGVLILLICCFSSWYAYTCVKIYNMEQQLTKNDAALQLLDESVSRRVKLTETKQEIDDKNSILINLSNQKISWYAMMVHLGNLVVDDVWLTEVYLSDKNELSLQGKSLDYQALASFVKKFEKDTLFSEAALINSKNMHDEAFNKDITVFEITAKFK